VPTIFTHPAAPLGLSSWFRDIPRSVVITAAIASALPDVDFLSFRLGIPYESPLGHRGLTHSLFFAAALALLLSLVVWRGLPARVPSFPKLLTYLFLSIASHGALDAMTNGGKGVGFFIPFSAKRYFLPWRPIRVSPIGATHFAAHAGAVLRSELLWVWLPFTVLAALGYALRPRRAISAE
jgi:inner membrane protein